MSQDEKYKEERIEGYLISDINASLATKEDYYTWSFRANGRKRYFNKSAAVFQVYWMAYRKLWMEAILFWFIQMIVISAMFLLLFIWNWAFFLSELWFTNGAMTICWSIQFLLIGYFGNGVYWRRLKKRLDQQNCKNRQEEDRMELHENLKASNGVSVLYVVIAMVGIFILNKIWVALLKAFIVWCLPYLL